MNTAIDVSADIATALTDLVVLRLEPESGWRLAGTGRYDDRFVRLDGRWLFQRRVVSWFKDSGLDRVDPAFEQATIAYMRELMAA